MTAGFGIIVAARMLLTGVILVLVACGCTSAEARGKRVALVIGNAAYAHTSPLANPRNDAEDLASALRGLGFEVVKGIDLKKPAMERTIRDFATALAGAEMGLFFYAGHGLQVGGVNYLVPIDAQLTTSSALDFEMIRLDLVQRAMESETQTNVILLDACRDNPLARNLARALGTRSASIGRGLAQFEAGVGTLISFSTQPGNVALDGKGRNSPYAAALVKHIATPAESLTSVLIRVRNEVITETASRQIPWDQHALRRPIHLAGHQAAGAPPQPSTAPRGDATDDVARAWSVTKDTASVAVLQAFADRHAGSIYADMARARIGELRQQMASAAAPPARAPPVTRAPVDGAAACASAGSLQLCASSLLPTSGVNTAHYGPRSLLDGDAATAWVEGVAGDGVGEWLVMDFGSERKVRGFRIVNGYAKSSRVFNRNGRVRRLALRFSNGQSASLAIDDTMEPRTYALPRTVSARWVRLEVETAVRGTAYRDTALSELRALFD